MEVPLLLLQMNACRSSSTWADRLTSLNDCEASMPRWHRECVQALRTALRVAC